MRNLWYFVMALYVRAKTYSSRRKNAPPADKTKVVYLFRELAHPLDVFNDLKYEGKASLLIANILVILFFVAQLLQAIYTGYLFQTGNPKDVNAWMVLAESVGIFVLFCICNWAVCSLNNGEGSMRDIWVVMSYSLLPYILFSFANLGLSHVLSQSEAVIFTTIQLIGTIWTLVLIFLGLLTVHQFTVAKTIFSIIFTLLFIVACFLLLLIFFAIAQQIYSFVYGVFRELMVR